ncbi:hypothetical protein ACQ86K_10770 [Mucilaginibacter sp. P19]|uniref:hypothetical protein n=1 Tax=Mucilaginibacter sp. P19 TaxID=3423947 RepID=UPI003D67D478
MNFNSKATPLAWPQLRKFILAMKLTAFIIIAALTNVSAKSYSQIVTLHQKTLPLKKYSAPLKNKQAIISCMISRMYQRPEQSTLKLQT